jgi:hypothetical protein
MIEIDRPAALESHDRPMSSISIESNLPDRAIGGDRDGASGYRAGASRGTRAQSRVVRGVALIGKRTLYWLPVLGPLVLFGQIALLGLRPAVCERARLADAELALETRYRADAAEHDLISSNLRARQDPIFLERQRRWLRVAAPAR